MSDQRLSALLFLLASPVLSQEAVRGRFDPQVWEKFVSAWWKLLMGLTSSLSESR